VSVGHGADQHSQLSMTILLQRSHTETIIGIEREKDSGELCYTLMAAAAAERAHENGIDRRHTFWVVAEGGSNGEVWAERRAGLPMTSLKRAEQVVTVWNTQTKIKIEILPSNQRQREEGTKKRHSVSSSYVMEGNTGNVPFDPEEILLPPPPSLFFQWRVTDH